MEGIIVLSMFATQSLGSTSILGIIYEDCVTPSLLGEGGNSLLSQRACCSTVLLHLLQSEHSFLLGPCRFMLIICDNPQHSNRVG